MRSWFLCTGLLAALSLMPLARSELIFEQPVVNRWDVVTFKVLLPEFAQFSHSLLAGEASDIPVPELWPAPDYPLPPWEPPKAPARQQFYAVPSDGQINVERVEGIPGRPRSRLDQSLGKPRLVHARPGVRHPYTAFV